MSIKKIINFEDPLQKTVDILHDSFFDPEEYSTQSNPGWQIFVLNQTLLRRKAFLHFHILYKRPRAPAYNLSGMRLNSQKEREAISFIMENIIMISKIFRVHNKTTYF